MNDDDPTKAEIDQFCRKFEECHKGIIERAITKKRAPYSTARGDIDIKGNKPLRLGEFGTRVLEKLVAAFKKNADFRDFYRENGMERIKSHIQWAYAIRSVSGELFREHYKHLPGGKEIESLRQKLLLRLAEERPGGLLFPLVRDRVPPWERRLLKKLLSERYRMVCETPATDGVGVWRHDERGRPFGLRLTGKGAGFGEDTLWKLVDDGYFDVVPAEDPNSVWYVDGDTPWTVRVREGALEAISAKPVSIHLPDGSDMDLSDDDPAELDQLDLPDVNPAELDQSVRFLTDGESLHHVLRHFVENGSIPAEHARAYLLHKVGEPPDYERLTLEQVAGRLELPVTRIKHWIPKYDALLYDNKEAQLLLLEMLRRNRAATAT